MAKTIIKNVKISSIACAVPNDLAKAEDFYESLGERKVNRFIKDAGVKQKFYSKNDEIIASDLCYAAAKKLLESKNIDKNDIGAIIFISQYPDYDMPATANILQYRLGLSEHCLAWDVNLGCSAYPYGIFIASKIIDENISKVLLLVGDNGSDPQADDFSHLNSLLFGSAGSATLLEYDKNAPKMLFEARTYGEDFEALGALEGNRLNFINNPKVDLNKAMDGLKVFDFSVDKTPKIINDFLDFHHKNIQDYEALLLHQANKNIIKMIARNVNIDTKKVPFSIDQYGNTSSASIPNLICHIYGNDDNDKNLPFLMVGYGIGMSVSMLDCNFNPKDILPIIHTNESFKRGREKALNARIEE